MEVGQRVPEALAQARVLDRTGAGDCLGAAWLEADAIVIFVRHFGCAACSEHLAELRPRLAELATLGVRVVVVGNGASDQLAAFVADQQLAGYPVEVVTDPTLAAYRAAGLDRARLGTVGPRALAALGLLALRGHSNGRVRGDRWQQGGTLYVRRGGELAFVHRSARIGDHAAIAEVVELALAARAIEAGVA
jgi:peroxiredoxin